MKDTFIRIFAILTITGLEIFAISKNIDGKSLAISLFLIGLLTPSDKETLKKIFSFIKIIFIKGVIK